jgi:hypothetical protein
MTILRWSMVASLHEPVFIVATVLFIAFAALIAYRTASPFSALELGALYGYVYGVIVWGLLGYYFGFDGESKLLFAGSSIVDGMVLCSVLHVILRRLIRKTAAH